MRQAIFTNSVISLAFWCVVVVGIWMKHQGDVAALSQQQTLLFFVAALLLFIAAVVLLGIRVFRLDRICKKKGISLSGRNFFRRSIKNRLYQREYQLQVAVILWMPFSSFLIRLLLLVVTYDMDYRSYQSFSDALSLTGSLSWPLALLLYALLSKDLIFQRS